jgi:uncharacterized membrane protein YkgB
MRRWSRAAKVTAVEAMLGVMFAVGVGLIVGAIHTVAGVGAGLLAFSVIAFLFVVALERGNVG